MIYKIGFLDFNWIVLFFNLGILLLFIRYIYKVSEVSVNYKIKVVCAFGLVWSSFPVFMFIFHIVANFSYLFGWYKYEEMIVNELVSENRYFTIVSDEINIRYAKSSSRCLSSEIDLEKDDIISVYYISDNENACILRVDKQ